MNLQHSMNLIFDPTALNVFSFSSNWKYRLHSWHRQAIIM